jgi:hypothetical protein
MPRNRPPASARSSSVRVPRRQASPTGPVTSKPGTVDPGQVGLPTADPALAFEALDDAQPLLLLPVRIETRFSRDSLRIRVYPDQVHHDAHDPLLTAAEQQFGHAYWRNWYAASDDQSRRAARLDLLGRLAPRRAAWVAKQTRPPAPRTRGAPLAFPALTLTTAPRPARASLLPARFVAIGYLVGEPQFTAWGKPVAPDLGLAPWEAKSGDPLTDERLAWMEDYARAEAAGMAITVDLKKLAVVASRGLDTLLVLGVNAASAGEAASAVADLLSAHRYTDGLAFLAQGAPTKNTDAGGTELPAGDPDGEAVLAAELDGSPPLVADSDGARLCAAFGLHSGVVAGADGASASEEESARAMNRLLWPSTWGQYLDVLLSGKKTRALTSSTVSFTQSWFLHHVRGGAPLPTLRIDRQPYGVLPVKRTRASGDPQAPAEWLEEMLLFLRERWREALPVVPLMNPTLGATGGDDAKTDPEEALLAVLGSSPHPTDLLVRTLHDRREVASALTFLNEASTGYDLLSIVGGWEFCLGLLSHGGQPYFGVAGEYTWQLDVEKTIHTADDQVAALTTLSTHLPDRIANESDRATAQSLVDLMISLVEQHKARQPPLNELTAPGLTFEGALGDPFDDPTIVFCQYDTTARTFTHPLVEAETPPAGASANEYLTALRGRFSPSMAPTGRAGALGSPSAPAAHPIEAPEAPVVEAPAPTDPPLLYQLIDKISDEVPAAERAAWRSELDLLAARDPDELELRLRETLGLATHRLDAWWTSLARERLDRLRVARATGLQAGAYGWVEDLRPDPTGQPASQGFIHAPSLAQASAAAVMRAGWSSHGTADGTSTLAVDLGSNRVRLAAWLLDGVRQGQALGELLGARFERTLQDSGLARFIDPCRRAVLGSAEAPRGCVDGVALLDGYAKGALADVLANAQSARTRLQAAIDGVQAALDAVGDAQIAESVHQVLEGNLAQTSASLDALSLGELPPPELRFADTPRGGPTVTHRLLALFGGASAGGWADTPRARLDPALEAWAAALLGPAARARAQVTIHDAAGATLFGPRWVTMGDLALGALDAVMEAPLGGLAGDQPWLRRIEAWARDRAGTVPAGTTLSVDGSDGGGAIGLDELALLCGAVRSLLCGARSLTPRDLVLPGGTSTALEDADDADARADALAEGFRAALAALTAKLPAASADAPAPVGDAPLADVRGAMSGLAGYTVTAAVPRAGWTGDDADRAALYAEAWALVGRAQAVAARLDALAAPTDSASRVARARAQVAELAGPLPLTVLLTGAGTAVAGALGRSGVLLEGDPARANAWLQQVGRVRVGARSLDQVATLADLLGGEPRVPLAVGQLPDLVGEPWAAQAAPPDRTGGRLAFAVIDRGGAAALAAQAPVSGLWFDEWMERVPAPTQVTGVALHFDAPAARAPQAWLLAVPPDGDSWDLALVTDTLLETIEMAHLRAVGAEDLAAYGHHLPAIFSPGVLSVGAQPTGDA